MLARLDGCSYGEQGRRKRHRGRDANSNPLRAASGRNGGQRSEEECNHRESFHRESGSLDGRPPSVIVSADSLHDCSTSFAELTHMISRSVFVT